MSKLLSRARVALDNAEYDYTKIGEDDCYLDACCYHLQQSIEFSLKFLVEMIGQSYAENHDIRSNLNILNREGYHVAMEEKLRNMSATLYGWETESRYRESFTAVISDVEDAFTLARSLVAEAQAKIQIL